MSAETDMADRLAAIRARCEHGYALDSTAGLAILDALEGALKRIEALEKQNREQEDDGR